MIKHCQTVQLHIGNIFNKHTMSDYESHKGKIRKVLPQGIETFEEMCKRLWVENGKKEEDYYERVLFDEFYDKYLKIKGICWEVFEHEDRGDADDQFCQLHDNGDGTFSFHTRFYNGGTGLSEMLADELKHQ